MVSPDSKSSAVKNRRCSPATIIITACLISLIAGFMHGRYFRDLKFGIFSLLSVSTLRPTSQQVSPPLGIQAWKPGSSVCLNTCSKARNGVCEDGRMNVTSYEVRLVHCDLGTDCDDCGPWTPSGPVSWSTSAAATTDKEALNTGPIALLKSLDIEVRVRRTRSTGPQFDFAFTDPAKDYDVSYHMQNTGGVELSITKIFYKIFEQKCRLPAADDTHPGGPSSLFVDVGGNFGWFSMLAAAMGCRVKAFEPVPHFRAFFEYTMHLNGYASRIHLRSEIVSHVGGSDMEMIVPSHGIWGTAGIDGLNIDKAIHSSNNVKISVPSIRLEDVVKEDVLLLKVDVEGWEWSVMKGAQALLKNYNVENIIMEYSPGVPERNFRHEEVKSTIFMLMDMIDSGYRIGNIGEQNKHDDRNLSAPLETLTEVTKGNLVYDLEDARRFKAGVLGCPIPKELFPFSGWQLCMGLPEDASPYSFRSILGHNTNIWAAKPSSTLHPLKGVVGMMAPGTDNKVYFVEPGELGMGSRVCAHIDPKVQVRHRCKCTNSTVCGNESVVVVEMAQQGKLPSNYILQDMTDVIKISRKSLR